MNVRKTHLLLLVLFFSLIQCAELIAGPGGKIAKEIFTSPAGKIIGLIIGIIFLPLIIYVNIREHLGVRKTEKDLAQLALRQPKYFQWLTVKDRIQEVFGRVHSAWDKEDMSEASKWMTNWYWQNQQLLFLDKWAREGLVNKCTVRSIEKIKPLMLIYSPEEKAEGSRLVVSIKANMEDYLEQRETKKLVEGKKGFRDVETVWTFILEDGQWILNNIEEDSMSLAYAKMKNLIPAFAPGQANSDTGKMTA